MFATLGISPLAVWAQTLTLLLKLQSYPQIKFPLHFYGTSYRFVLKSLTNSYNQDTAPL